MTEPPADAAALGKLLLAPEEAASISAHGSAAAAVLVPLFFDDGHPHAVFTRRRDDLRRHAGEISFPGGRPDHPAEGLEQTALREAHEEIGLPPDHVTVVGALPPTPTFVTGYRISPFVGLIEPGFEWVLQPTEVDEVLEFRLAELVAGFELRRLVRRGVPFKTPTYTVDDQLVWGATARILGNLLERLDPIL